MEVNIPKFLQEDIRLFRNIIDDLFPETSKPNVERETLQQAVTVSLGRLNLAENKEFMEKVFQLYDTIRVRHGLMLIGPTGGGKTTAVRVL